MRPIPQKLLIHNASLKHPTGTDVWQNATYAASSLSKVRIEPSSRIVKSKDNTEIQLAATLFYDCVNSLPSGAAFAVGDRVVFDGTEYAVQTVERMFDGVRLHHIEAGLT